MKNDNKFEIIMLEHNAKYIKKQRIVNSSIKGICSVLYLFNAVMWTMQNNTKMTVLHSTLTTLWAGLATFDWCSSTRKLNEIEERIKTLKK